MKQQSKKLSDFSDESTDSGVATSFVQDVFSRVASRYDMMNDAMSFGLHRKWKKTFAKSVAMHPDMTILDVASGTGDISRVLLDRAKELGVDINIEATDLNESMLEEGKSRLRNKGYFHNLNWTIANAESLPYPDSSFDTYVISFGLRNVADKNKALNEAYRVLKPGGQFLCMEFSHVEPKLMKHAYQFYSRNIIPRLGQLIARDQSAYQYLVESIRNFPDQLTLSKWLEDANFKHVTFNNLTSGIVAIHAAWKAKT